MVIGFHSFHCANAVELNGKWKSPEIGSNGGGNDDWGK